VKTFTESRNSHVLFSFDCIYLLKNQIKSIFVYYMK